MNQSLEELLASLKFNNDGLIVAITQEQSTKRVLMQAWMNRESIIKTLQTGKVTYFSRSRSAIWVKGETSGNTQDLVSLSSDCDGDSLLIVVNQKGAACHTGEQSCFDAGIGLERQP